MCTTSALPTNSPYICQQTIWGINTCTCIFRYFCSSMSIFNQYSLNHSKFLLRRQYLNEVSKFLSKESAVALLFSIKFVFTCKFNSWVITLQTLYKNGFGYTWEFIYSSHEQSFFLYILFGYSTVASLTKILLRIQAISLKQSCGVPTLWK